MHEKLLTIYDGIVEGEGEGIGPAIILALEEKFQADQVLYEAMIPAMDEVGRLYEQGIYFLPEMLVAAQTMQTGVKALKPFLVESGVESFGKIAIGTVKGDLHDIGKNLVMLMLEGAGFEVQDLGVDVATERFIEAIQSGAEIIGLSSLLTTTLVQMKITIDALEKAGLRKRVKVIIGGPVVTKALADQIGADGYAPDAGSAVKLVRNILGME